MNTWDGKVTQEPITLTRRGRWVVAVGWVLVTGTLGWFAYDIANWVWGR